MKIGEQRRRYTKLEIKKAFEKPITLNVLPGVVIFKVDPNVVFTEQQMKQFKQLKISKKIG